MTYPDSKTAPRHTKTFVWLHKPFTQTDKTQVFIPVWLSGYEWAKKQPEPDKVYFEIKRTQEWLIKEIAERQR